MSLCVNIFLLRLFLFVFLLEFTYGCMAKTYVNCGGETCRRACNGDIPDANFPARDYSGCNCGCQRDDFNNWMPNLGYPGCRMGFCNSGHRFSVSYSSIIIAILLFLFFNV